MMNRNKGEGGTPVYSTNFDTTMEHLVPDYSVVLKEALYTPIERRLLSGLGLIEIVEGITSTRREAILNPKPFIREVETGINDFATLLLDVIYVVKERNAQKHPKYVNEEIELHHTPVKDFISDSIRDHLRSMYDRGVLSKETYAEVVGDVDLDIEITRRTQETKDDLEVKMYPPIIDNREGTGIDLQEDSTGIPKLKNILPKQKTSKPPFVPKPNNEDLPPAKTGPEAKNFKGEIEVEPYDGTDTEFLEALEEFAKIYEEAPYKTNKDLPPAVKKYSSHAQSIFRNAFNNALKQYNNESTAFKVAWNAMKKYLNKGEDTNE
jgi:cation transport regulator